MRIRYIASNYSKTEIIYDSVRDYRIKSSTDVVGNEYWFISDGTNNFRLAVDYKFATAEDAENLVQDIYEFEARKYAVYDVNNRIEILKKQVNLKLL